MRKIFCFAILTMMALTSVQAQKGWKWERVLAWDRNDQLNYGACLYLTDKAEGEIIVPETMTIKGETLPVTKVADDSKCFKNSKYGSYTKVVLPSSIQDVSLGGSSLKEVVFKEGPYRLSCSVRHGMKFEKLVLPNSIKEIDFLQCWAQKVVFPQSLKKIKKVSGSIQEIELPEGLEVIDGEAFSGLHLKGKLVLPKNMKCIADRAFSYNDFEEVVFPENITDYLGERCFANNDYLRTVVLPRYVKRCGNDIFKPNTFINVSVHNGDVADWVTKNVDREIFWKMERIRESYSYFMKSHKGQIEQQVAAWQKRGEFETVDKWKQRVTEKNRSEYVKKLMEDLRQEYINKEKPSKVPTRILKPYDMEQEVFPIQLGNNLYSGNMKKNLNDVIYVKVPLAEAPSFKSNFKDENLIDQYDIVQDHVKLTGYLCKVGNKNYEIINQYEKADKEVDIALNLPPLEMDFSSASSADTSKSKEPKKTTDRTIDLNIPTSPATNSNTFAVIIGNENYSMVAKVAHAKNDAQVMAEYCRKTLGIPSKNVRTYGDATFAMMMNAVKDIQDIAKVYNGNIKVLFYYAGHGIPDEKSKDAYLLPVDADGRQISFCYPVSKLYQELGSMNVQSVVVMMDACFSGALRGNGMLMAARGVALKAKPQTPQGKMVVLTAASGDETAYPYEEKCHGMFTYFLLKKLRDSKGNCTLGELSSYIESNVQQQSVVVNRKKQTPSVLPSPTIGANWRTMKLK